MNTHPAPTHYFCSYRSSTAVECIRMIPMSLIWRTVYESIVLVLEILDAAQTVAYLIENKDLGIDAATIIGVIAGCTFSFGMLWLSSMLSNGMVLGLAPIYDRLPSGPIWMAFPLYVAAGYLSSYGFSLSYWAFLVGTALVLQVERWLYSFT